MDYKDLCLKVCEISKQTAEFIQLQRGKIGIENTEVKGINDFVTEHQINLVITIPKKHGLFDRLFKRSHTKHLAFHTHIPIMCIHEDF